MASGFSLKDQLFNRDKVRYLAGLFAAADTGFDAAGFEDQIMLDLPALELKQRITLIAGVLAAHLPQSLPEAAPVLLQALPPPLDPGKTDDDFGDFIFAPLGEFVVAKGLRDHPDLGLDLLEALTQRFSMEWAIRPFLNAHQELTLARMRGWAEHSSYHVRRLVSEGTRPRLPWGEGVGLSLRDPLPLLDMLHADPTRYVTRSVANHLNDISKKDPELVLECLADWHRRAMQAPKELDWITSHACRGLVKSGHEGAMRLLGYDPDAALDTQLTLKSKNVQIGEDLVFEVEVKSPKELPVIVDYIVLFHRPDGKTSQKVFKMKKARTSSGKLSLVKRHRLKGDATTFKLHPGPHVVKILVNGKVRAEAGFELLAAP